ncbi:trypsin-like peptidase domain-containing protein [Micromonospora cathayae]|uniref:Trypsin-like peptidase domain-containing protein n=1 Tax=Micromonospora cathayae TaxID=3028804 RepID=A0ABY7ZZP9_9ACTN|nr:trypsin-like peptidase domain-containing protein [Micromonospora sp. HUAS 3]WDZ87488.1 trypsin-like peptidase domain-containing protein [Micromonospora sp. HUAS 3]
MVPDRTAGGAALAQLEHLLVHAVAGVREAGGEAHSGSAFWVAPEWLLTCAHVTKGQVGDTVRVSWDNGGKELDGTIEAIVGEEVPDRPLHEYPDLALVRVPGADDHPCVWLAEEYMTSRTPLSLFGYVAGLDGRIGMYKVAGECTNWARFGLDSAGIAATAKIEGGMSGGPVLNTVTGAVRGLTVMAQGQDSGLYVSVRAMREFEPDLYREVLRAHDLFHARDHRWTSLRDDLTRKLYESSDRTGKPTAAQQVGLLGVLARATDDTEQNGPAGRDAERDRPAGRDAARDMLLSRDAGRLTKIYVDVVGRDWPGPESPGSVRDVLWRALEWADLWGLAPLGALAGLVLPREQDRKDWQELISPGRPETEPGTAGHRGREAVTPEPAAPQGVAPERTAPADDFRFVVTVGEITEPGREPGYDLTVQVLSGSAHPDVIHQDEDTSRDLAATKRLIGEALRTALNKYGGRARLVEFVLPPKLLNEPFDEITLSAEDFLSVGEEHPVVVRTRREPRTRHRWEHRWHSLTRAESVQPRSVTCAYTGTPESLGRELVRQSDLGVLTLTRRPSAVDDDQVRGFITVAIQAGVPVIVWPRPGCPRHDGDGTGHCAGQRFSVAFEQALTEWAAREGEQRRPRWSQDLPRMVTELRFEAGGAEQHDCRGLVLLLDDPDRPADDLRAPPIETNHDGVRR